MLLSGCSWCTNWTSHCISCEWKLQKICFSFQLWRITVRLWNNSTVSRLCHLVCTWQYVLPVYTRKISILWRLKDITCINWACYYLYYTALLYQNHLFVHRIIDSPEWGTSAAGRHSDEELSSGGCWAPHELKLARFSYLTFTEKCLYWQTVSVMFYW